MLHVLVQALCLLAAGVTVASAQQPTYRTWILAEGAAHGANGFFTEEILIGNPNAAPTTVQITLLPESGPAPAVQTAVSYTHLTLPTILRV